MRVLLEYPTCSAAASPAAKWPGSAPGWTVEGGCPYVSGGGGSYMVLAMRRVLFSARLTTARCGPLFPGRLGDLLHRQPGVGPLLRRWLLREPLFSSCGRRWRI